MNFRLPPHLPRSNPNLSSDESQISKERENPMKSMTMQRLIPAILLIFPTMLGAQYADWTQYTNGRHITAIAEEGGFAWIGTTGGLVRVDTLTLLNQFFNTANSGLPSNDISAIVVDNQGNKWIGTKGKGLVRYDGSTYTYFRSAVLGSDIVNALALEEDTLWVGTNGGAARFNGTGWTIYSGDNFLPSDTVTAIAFGAGIGWIGTAKGVVQYQHQDPQFSNQTANLPNDPITSVSVTMNMPRYPWVGMQNGGVGQLVGTAWTIYTTTNGLPSNFIRSITLDVNGRVLAATPGGLGFYDGTTWRSLNTGNSQIPENTVGKVLWKSLGNKAYVGTVTGGLSTLAFSDTSWSIIPTSNSGLINDAVNGVAVSANGRIGAGSTDYLTYYDIGTWTTYSSAALGVAQSGFRCVAMDASGFPWVGTQGQGVLYFNGMSWTTYSYPSTLGFPSDNNVDAVAVAPNGDVWVATWRGVGRFNGIDWTTYDATSTPALPGDGEIGSLAIGSDGTVWVTDNTSLGPIKFNGSAWTVQSGASIGLIPALFKVHYVTAAGEPWLGTPYSGAVFFNNTQWSQYNTTNTNMPSNNVYSIAPAGDGTLWFGLDDGLVRFDRTVPICRDIFQTHQPNVSGLTAGPVNALAVGPDLAVYAATDSGLAKYTGFQVQAEPILQTRPTVLAFGNVVVGDADTLITVLKNIGTADLILTAVQFPAAFTLIENAVYPDTLAPGDSLVGNIRFAPTQATGYVDTIVVYSSAPTSPNNYIVTGTGIPGLNEAYMEIRNRMFQYDTLTVGRTRTISTYIKNTGFTALRIDSLKFNVTNQSVYSLLSPAATLPVSVLEGDSILISIRFQPQDVIFYGGLVKIVSNSFTSPDTLYIGGEGVASSLAFTGDEVHIHTGLYGMITIPYVLADRRIESVLSSLGPYSSRAWRLYHWINSRYYEYPEFPPADSLVFRPGISYWLISNDTLQLNLRNVKPTPAVVDTGIYARVANFRITLRPGWNMIGNPFAYPVQWSQVLNTASVQTPVVYNVRWQEYDMDPYTYDITTLEPWRGYFVYNRTASPIVIQVPPFNVLTKPSGPRTLAGDEFILKAQARGVASKLRTAKVSVGMLAASEDGPDVEDYFEAPPIGDGLRLSIMDGKNRYAGNFKSISSAGASWDVLLSTTGGKEKVNIRLDGLAELPEGFKVFLLDRDRECVIPVQNSEAEVMVEGPEKASQIRVIVGTDEYAEQKSGDIPLVPHEFALKQNYPNPFNPETHILYSLSQKGMVKLTVYNTLGRRVRTLFQGEQTTGQYTVTWDGKDDAGLAVNSGVYVCRLEAGQFAISKKMILIR